MELQTIFLGLVFLLSSLQAQLSIMKNAEVKMEIKNAIMQCESKGNPNAINENDKKITGYSSYGLYQFQPPTFLKAGIKYKIFPPETTLKEAMKYIKNPIYNAAVAHALLEDEQYNHWKNCYEKIK
mgnify:CR=1 FL=1